MARTSANPAFLKRISRLARFAHTALEYDWVSAYIDVCINWKVHHVPRPLAAYHHRIGHPCPVRAGTNL